MAFITDFDLFDLVKKTIRSDVHIVSPFDVFRSFLLSEDEIQEKIFEFQKGNADLAKISRLENPEFAENSSESQDSIKKMILPPSYEKTKRAFDQIENLDVDEILEKYVILSYLVDDTFINKLKFDIPYFKRTIFRKFFEDYSCQDILKKISEIDKKYKELFDKLHNWEMQRMLKLPFVGHRKDNKKINFSQKANEFLVDPKKVKYLHSVLDEEKQTMTLFKIYYKEIEKQIFNEYSNKRIPFKTLQDFQNFSEGKFTVRNVAPVSTRNR